MITKSASAYALSPSSVAVRSSSFSAKYLSMHSSWIGLIRLLIFSTFSGMMSTAVT